MRVRVALISVLVLLSSVGLTATRAATAMWPRMTQEQDRRAAANEAFAAADWQEAALGYEALVAADPSDIQSWMFLGQARAQLGEHEAAVEAYEQLLEHDEAGTLRGQALLRLARSLAALGRDDQAADRVTEFAAAAGPANRGAAQALGSAEELAGLRNDPRYLSAMSDLTPCGSPEYRQFDFWLGRWNAYAPNGTLAGTSVIESVLGGCALHESWTGATGFLGNSYNFYNSNTGHWHQTWIDYNGAPLFLEGGIEDGQMRLVEMPNRITWTPLPDGSVRQHWETTADGGVTWTTAFDAEYRRAEDGS